MPLPVGTPVVPDWLVAAIAVETPAMSEPLPSLPPSRSATLGGVGAVFVTGGFAILATGAVLVLARGYGFRMETIDWVLSRPRARADDRRRPGARPASSAEISARSARRGFDTGGADGRD